MNECQEMKPEAKLQALADDLGCVARLLSKPSACMAALEIMDVIRIACNDLQRRLDSMAQDARDLPWQYQERCRCADIVLQESGCWTQATMKYDMCNRIYRKITGHPLPTAVVEAWKQRGPLGGDANEKVVSDE